MTTLDRWLLHLTFAMTTFHFFVIFTYFIFAVVQPEVIP